MRVAREDLCHGCHGCWPIIPPSCVFSAVQDRNSEDNDAICEALAKVLSTNRTLRSLGVTSMFGVCVMQLRCTTLAYSALCCGT